MKTKILITGLLITLLISQASALAFYRNPESPFYGMFRFMERIESVFVLDNRRRMEVVIMHAERRAEELAIVRNEATFARIQTELQEGVERADRLGDQISNEATRIRLRERLRVLNTKSLQVLEQIRTRFQEQGMVVAGIENAIQKHQEIKLMVEQKIRGGNN